MGRKKNNTTEAAAEKSTQTPAAAPRKYEYIGPKGLRLNFPGPRLRFRPEELTDEQIDAITDQYAPVRQYFQLTDKGSKDE